MRYSISNLARKLEDRQRLAVFGAVLALALIVVQSIELTHTHENYLQQVNCEICLKVGSEEEAILADSTNFDTVSIAQSSSELIISTPYLAVLTANPRAPPQV